METQALHDDAQCTVALRDDVVLVDIHEAIRSDHVQAVLDLTERSGGNAAGSVGVLVRVCAGVALPTVETRASFVHYLRTQHGRVRSIHVALEGHGFWAATMTALAASIARAVPYGPPIHVYDGLDRAASELVARLRQGRDSSVDCSRLTSAFRRAS